ncbi:glycosyltransferase family 2 protein [Lysobacter fragariae]
MSTPKLSVVVIAYNMRRELPRTLRTLSPACQRDIDADDYEVIVVDNGSADPLDEAACRELCPNARLHVVTAATPSPVAAINQGLAMARGALVGVCIDGARMASPRLLATALEAAQLHPRPVIGTIAFHLGPDVQMRSVANGYNQQVEDALLASIDWESDGYQLFSISVLAGSSAAGWFEIPAETNALFLTREQWQDLGGYDPAFVAPGGGLVNLDTWARACADPRGQVIMLLGEATFHQVHGGIATNSAVSKWKLFHDEYVQVRGVDYTRPTGRPLLVGRFPAAALPTLRQSLQQPHDTRKERA